VEADQIIESGKQGYIYIAKKGGSNRLVTTGTYDLPYRDATFAGSDVTIKLVHHSARMKEWSPFCQYLKQKRKEEDQGWGEGRFVDCAL
jgi:hypothetical protein